ncbi:MAG: hypothetical protein HOQ32_13805 [Lysobacter sp.]|nr:hypothetical protein [Lysobacter sp.]
MHILKTSCVLVACLAWSGIASACVYKEASTVVDGNVATYGFYDCSSLGGGGTGGGSGGGTGTDPGGWNGGGPGGGVGSGGEFPDACTEIKYRKPAACPNPVAFPIGPDYGEGQFAWGSALAKVLYLKNASGLLKPNEKQHLDSVLAEHTLNSTYLAQPMDQASMYLIMGVARTCEMIVAQDPTPGRTAISKCHDAVEALTREAGGQGFADAFRSWMNLNDFNIGIGKLDLAAFVAAFAPENSLSTKFKLTQETARCHEWWSDIQAYQCSVQ